MRYHVNPETGDAGKCSANKGNCPFGGENEHYTSSEAARAAFEAKQDSQVFAKLPLKELNAQSKTTDDPGVINAAIEQGSERTLGNVAKNPNLTPTQAAKALARATSPKVRAAILVAGGEPNQSMTPEDLEEVLLSVPNNFLSWAKLKDSSTPIGRVVNSPHLTDAHFDQIAGSKRLERYEKGDFARVLAQENHITSQRLQTWLEDNNWATHPLKPETALTSGKLTEAMLANAPEKYLSYFATTGLPHRLTSGDITKLGSVALKRNHERLQYWIASDTRTREATLTALVDQDLQLERVYANPSSSSILRKRIEDKLPKSPAIRMAKLKEKLGPSEFGEIVKAGNSAQLGRAYSQKTQVFDMERVRKYGLTNDDIFFLGKANQYNAGASFNPVTGELTGQTDSSD